MRKSVKIASGTVGTAVLVGLGAGCAGGSMPVVHTVAHTVPDPNVTKTVAVPGPTVTKTVAVPGPTVTQTVTGPAQVVAVPGPVQVVNVPGPTVTQTVTAPAPTVTVTQTASDPQTASGPPPTAGSVLDAFRGRGHEVTPRFNVPVGGVYIIIWSYSGNTDPRRGSPTNFTISQNGSGLRGDLPNDIAASGQGRTEVTCARSTTDSLDIQAAGSWTITIEVSVVNGRPAN